MLTPSHRLATVAGTAEPTYGAEALHSVALQEDENPTYEITPEDLHWRALPYTAAETQTFYLEADSGHYAIVQIINSNVACVATRCRSLRAFADGGVIGTCT